MKCCRHVLHVGATYCVESELKQRCTRPKYTYHKGFFHSFVIQKPNNGHYPPNRAQCLFLLSLSHFHTFSLNFSLFTYFFFFACSCHIKGTANTSRLIVGWSHCMKSGRGRKRKRGRERETVPPEGQGRNTTLYFFFSLCYQANN